MDTHEDEEQPVTETETQVMASITQLVRYPVTREEIETKRAEFAAITFDTTGGYEQGRKAIAHCRNTRVAIEERRKELKRPFLAGSRRIDSVAKDLTSLIEGMEEPLQLKKDAVDAEKERVKREAEEAERRVLEEKVRQEREEEEARLRAQREAEEQRLADERAAIEAERAKLEEQKRRDEEAATLARQRLEDERRAFEEQQRVERDRAETARRAEEERARAEKERVEAEQRAERDRLEQERREFAAAKEKADREEFERQAKIRAEQEAKERAAREAREAEERRIEEGQRQECERARLEAMRPDVEKVRAFGKTVRALKGPEVSSVEAEFAMHAALADLDGIAAELEAFGEDAVGAETAAE